VLGVAVLGLAIALAGVARPRTDEAVATAA
jgi:hypothetical protein